MVIQGVIMKFIQSKLLVALLLLSISSSCIASYEQWPLQHKGEVRYLKMVKVYDVGLYSPTKLNNKNVLNPSVSKCLKLDYAVNLTVDKFRLATSKVLSRQHTPQYLDKIKQPLAALQNSYQPVKKGDSYVLCYNGKNQVLRLMLNKKKLFEMKSHELARAYLGIWLSNNKPISGPLYRSFFNNVK